MLGLRTTIYRVPDLQKAKEWYAKVFKVAPYFENEFYVGFNIKGYELGLEKSDSIQEKSDNVLSYWGVNNIDETYSFLLNSNATEHSKPINVGGEIVVASVKDPWNNVLGIIFNPEFKLNT